MRVRLGAFELDSEAGRLRRDGEDIALQPKVYALLELLVEQPQRLWSKEELVERLWPGVSVTQESLSQLVHKLRAALDDDAPRAPRFIQTVARRGYRFIAPVTAQPSVTPDSSRSEWVPGATRAAPRRRIAGGVVVGIALLALAALAVRHTRRPEGLALTPSSEIRITRLTSTPQRETMPHIAADGRRYVYTANDAVELQLDLFIAATAGGDPLRLTHTPEDEVDPRLSPSGDWVLFARERGERRGVWRLPAFGGAERLVAVGGWSPAWSPDGVAVVFVRTGGRGRSDLVHVELQGTGGERTLVAGAVEIASPAFAPDGSQVAYVSSNAAWVVPTEGGTPRRLGAAADYLRSVSWDPAGGALLTDGVWGGLAGGLWRLRLDRNSPDVLAAVGAGAFDPSVAADGRRLLYAREHKVQELWRFDAAGRRGERLEVPITLDCFDVDAAGRRVAYFDYDPPPGRATLGLVDLESGERRDLGDALCPAFSPDGSRLAFLGWRQGDDGLFVLDLRSDELRTVARNESRGKHDEADLLRRPAWSPDGRWLAFDARLPIGGGLRLARSDGSSERSLGGRLVGLPAWSGDGRQILSCHLATAPGALVAIDVASASEGVLHEGRVLREGCAHRALPSALPSGGIALLTEARRPRVLVLDQEGRESAPTVELRLEQDPSVWGVYGLRPVPGGWIAHLERYESDLFLIEAL